ncbi:MTMRB protein, partial [Bucorvus abyssinicus]|nr:MTMRB protein [Bucorvus abyssinicus]
ASSFGKPKVLTAASTLKFIPEELAVFCRDFRLLRFYFHENGLAPQAFRVANAIVQAREAAAWLGDAGEGHDGWSCPPEAPSEDEEEEEEGEEGSGATLLFESLRDWEKELKRLGAAGWRVSAVNERFDMAPRYGPAGRRGPCAPSTPLRLCWHHPGGGDLLRAAAFHAASEPGSEDVSSLLAGRRCSVLLQGSAWQSTGAGGRPGDPPSPPRPRLAEPSDRDLNCLLASLVQLLGDPHARTLPGFQSLVQREWVAAGHPFPRRLGLLRGDSPREEAPVFLLFLDCTWQLVRQFPAAFGFTEAYLLALHDSSFAPYSSTFLFSCQRQRGRGAPHRPRGQTYTPVKGWRDPQLRDPHAARGLPVVWHWGLRYSRQQRAQFRNPAGTAGTVGPPDTTDPQTPGRPADAWPGPGNVFVLTKGTLSPQPFPWRSGRPPPRLSRWAPSLESLGERGVPLGDSRPPPGLLLPCAAGPSLRLWRRCYLRGLPEAQRGRFAPSPAGLAEELSLLQDRLRSWQAPGPRAEAAGSPLAPSR